MKSTLFTILLILLFVSTVYLPLSDAQDATTNGLPDGAKAHLGTGQVYAYSPDGNSIAVAGFHGVIFYDAQTYRKLFSIQEGSSVHSIAFSPDEQTFASGGSNKTLRLWKVETGELKHELIGHSSWITSVAFSPDGQTLASGSDDKTIRLWKVETGELKHELIGHSRWMRVAFSPDGQTLASGVWATVRLWNVETGELKHELTGHRGWIASVAFSPDGQTLASNSIDDTVRLWKVETGELKHKFIGLAGIDESERMAFSQDGQTIASTGRGRTVRLWKVETGELKHELIGHQADCVAFSPDRQTLASGGWETIYLWNVETGELKHELIADDMGGVDSLAFSPDGHTLASRVRGGQILLWEITPAPIAPIAETPQRTADVNGDGTINIQDLISVAGKFSAVAAPDDPADVNKDGTIDDEDLIAVDTALGEAAGAPTIDSHANGLTRETVQRWLTEAKALEATDPVSLRGIAVLQQLLLELTPKETALLANYPNPFNPETWIPYKLAAPAAVTVRIYAVDGSLVRALDLGHQSVGIYESKSRAAYWDGRNAVGEPIASGIYFYTLTTGDFSATRKMLIRK